MKCLTYPFDSDYILKKKKSIKRSLLASDIQFVGKKIAVLGGSTTTEVINIMELFLLNFGIKPEFYESEYAQYWQDAIFGDKLESFKPDIVYVHTSSRNITAFPTLHVGKDAVDSILEQQLDHFRQMWNKLLERGCCVIQNNFERPIYRLLGNRDISDYCGHSNFISRLNQKFYEYAQENNGFYINDIDYLSASYGLEKWSDPSSWYMYKYALTLRAIPELAFSVANIIKSIYGGNKKAFLLDLDNTLWGGIIGDDGVEGLKLGHEHPEGQAYTEFQKYLKTHMDLGVLLTVCSKNDEENAILGLEHPDSTLSPGDFAIIKANWENKDRNVIEIAQELRIGVDSLVFVDDNPAERALVTGQITGVSVPEIGTVEDYIRCIDKSGFFEVTTVTGDDLLRGRMYRENALRAKQEQSFENYKDYLTSLEMTATIRDFDLTVIQRVTQLTNKTNQFNLTTKRYSESDIAAISAKDSYIRLYGRLEDKFGDNGIVSVIIGRKDGDCLHIDLWLMSCRVLKRDMEFAMMDRLVEECCAFSIKKIIGYYFPTKKNSMVMDFYHNMGFVNIDTNGGGTVWECDISDYEPKNHVIKLIKLKNNGGHTE